MNKKVIIFLICFLETLSAGVFANDFSVSARLDSSQIQIGEQTKLHFEVLQPAKGKVIMPIFRDTVVSGVEVVKALKPDTIHLENGRIKINQNYLITAFDSGYYTIPSIRFALGQQIAATNPIALRVNTVKVDVKKDDIKDIKSVMDAPFSWKELFKWIGLVLGALLIVALIVYLLMKYVFKKDITILPAKEEVKLPPHVVAIGKLEKIKTEKLWQTGHIKEFYIQLTDVIREYMQNRFGISALEMTSDEILRAINSVPEAKLVRDNLYQVLKLSDLVKFAKFVPLQNENDLSLVNAYILVDKTKQEEVVPEQPEKEKEV